MGHGKSLGKALNKARVKVALNAGFMLYYKQQQRRRNKMFKSTTGPQVVYIESGQPLRTMGRDCIFIGEEGVYTRSDMVKVQDVITDNAWSLRLDRITSANKV